MSLALSNMYVIRKNCALWQVVLKSSGIVQFSSLSKARCNDWLASQFLDSESKKKMIIKSNAKTPFDLQVIYWIVDTCSGNTICEAWKVQYEIDCLEKAGYKIITVERK